MALAFALSFCMEGRWSFALWPFAVSLGAVFLLRKRKRGFSFRYFVLGYVLFLLSASISWGVKVFPLENPLQVYLTLQMPLDGLTSFFVKKYAVEVALPGILVAGFLTSFFYSVIHSVRRKKLLGLLIIVCVCALDAIHLGLSVPIFDYLEFSKKPIYSSSPFFKQYYVPAELDKVELSAEQPKNLIFIMMESMESSYADSLSGGVMRQNLIPELQELEREGFNFSSDNLFGGGYDVTGTDFTSAATAAAITGVPLLSIMSFGDSTLGRALGVFDILHQYSYKNVFVMGSDANFSNMRPFLLAHGVDELYDIHNLEPFLDASEEFKSKTFAVGMTDKTLLNVSKKILDSLSKKDHFTMTIATIETHYPHGFYNPACEDKPVDASDEATLVATVRCASKDMRAFVEWIQEQPFYKNTEIVIVGDHLFAGKILLPENTERRRWLDLFINAERKPERMKNRMFTSMDLAPTILESMGFAVEDGKMGFGVSLFANENTLLEVIGLREFSRKISSLRMSTEYNLLNFPLEIK